MPKVCAINNRTHIVCLAYSYSLEYFLFINPRVDDKVGVFRRFKIRTLSTATLAPPYSDSCAALSHTSVCYVLASHIAAVASWCTYWHANWIVSRLQQPMTTNTALSLSHPPSHCANRSLAHSKYICSVSIHAGGIEMSAERCCPDRQWQRQTSASTILSWRTDSESSVRQ